MSRGIELSQSTTERCDELHGRGHFLVISRIMRVPILLSDYANPSIYAEFRAESRMIRDIKAESYAT